MPKSQARIFTILYVDDNPGDVELAREAIDVSGLDCRLLSVSDGVEALDFLYRRGKYAKTAPRPDIILLDWNMPKLNGLGVLKLIKHDKHLHAIPVIIFTSSSQPEDIAAAYGADANCYIVKPMDLDLFLSTVTSIAAHWLNVANWNR